MTPERFAATVGRLPPLYGEVGVEPPAFPKRFAPEFEEQDEAVMRAAAAGGAHRRRRGAVERPAASLVTHATPTSSTPPSCAIPAPS